MVTREIHRSGDTYYGTGVSPSLNFATVFKDIHALLQSYDVIRLLSGLYYVQSTPNNSLGEMAVTKDYITIDADPGAILQRSTLSSSPQDNGGISTDYAMLLLKGKNDLARGISFDDNFGGWSSFAVGIGGTDNTVENCYLTKSERYGFGFPSAVRGTARRLTIDQVQHGISGSSGIIGDWRGPSYDCIVEECNISGMSNDGIKLKQMVRAIIRNNKINVASSVIGSNKSGIYFAGSDTANKDCIVEYNEVYTTNLSIPRYGYGINIHQDQQTDTSVISTGNKVRNNTLKDLNIGVYLTGSHYTIENNKMVNIPTAKQIVTETLVYGYTFPPPTDNIVTVNPLQNLTLQSNPPVYWMIDGSKLTNKTYPIQQNKNIIIQVPKQVE